MLHASAFPSRSKLIHNEVIQIDEGLWGELESLLSDRRRVEKKTPPTVIGIDVSPISSGQLLDRILAVIINPPTGTLLELTSEEYWSKRPYSRNFDAIKGLEKTERAPKEIVQKPLGRVRDALNPRWPLTQSFAVRYSDNGRGVCRLWSADARYRPYCHRKDQVEVALYQNPDGVLYPFIPPFELRGRKRFQTLRLYFAWNKDAEHFDCVGGIAVEERWTGDPCPELRKAIL